MTSAQIERSWAGLLTLHWRWLTLPGSRAAGQRVCRGRTFPQRPTAFAWHGRGHEPIDTRQRPTFDPGGRFASTIATRFAVPSGHWPDTPARILQRRSCLLAIDTPARIAILARCRPGAPSIMPYHRWATTSTCTSAARSRRLVLQGHVRMFTPVRPDRLAFGTGRAPRHRTPPGSRRMPTSTLLTGRVGRALTTCRWPTRTCWPTTCTSTLGSWPWGAGVCCPANYRATRSDATTFACSWRARSPMTTVVSGLPRPTP